MDMQITQQDIVEALAQSTMLVTYTSWSWTAKATDKEGTDDVRRARNAEGDVGNFTKKLLANNEDAYLKVKSAIGAAYRDHCRLTAPWAAGKGGPRMMPNSMLMEYIERMARHKAAVDKAVEEFVVAYPAARDKAIKDLGGLANVDQYPKPEDVAKRFGIMFDIEPMTGAKTFTGLDAGLASALEQRLHARTKQRMQAAIDDLWKQIRELLVRYTKQMRPDGKVYDDTVEEVQQLPARVRAFNVIGDVQLDAVAGVVEKELSMYSVKAIKDDDKIRAWCHDRGNKVVGMLP